MKLSEIHAAIEAGQGPTLPEDQAFATLVAIERLAQIKGLPVSALDFAAPSFGAMYPYTRKDFHDLWPELPQYLAWRNLILNAQMHFAPGDVDADPWLSLCRAERLLTRRKGASICYTKLYSCPHPRDLTDAHLAKVCADMSPKTLLRFRASLNAFRQLFKNDLALRSGLLPDVCPAPLPGIRDHRLLVKMSPEIERWRTSLSKREVILALDYVNRLAIAGGRLNGETDTLDDLRLAICDLPSPTHVGVPPIQERALAKYSGLVRRELGGPDPRKTRAEQAWSDLRSLARSRGCATTFLWALSKPAAARDISPWEVTDAIALDLMRSYEKRKMGSMFRQGCEQFDALRGLVQPDLLPPSPLGIQRTPRPPPSNPKSARIPDPVQAAWAHLYVRLRERGWKNAKLSQLSYLRTRAAKAGIHPSALNHEFIGILAHEVRNKSDANRLLSASRHITALSKDPQFTDLPDLVALKDRWFSHGGATPQARDELEELMNFINASPSTRRGFRVAIGVLTDAMGRPDLSLREILQADMSVYDIGAHEPRRRVHASKIGSIREFIELPWTSAWRELQKVVVGTGVTAQDNPVTRVLSWNPGTDPGGLTLEWAQQLDRELRSTLKNPPHGRADKAKTLARHLAAFDALHEIPAVAESGLLPPRIGAIRQSVE